jgi:uncharacterized integral membrane protein (TIGR00698 family)
MLARVIFVVALIFVAAPTPFTSPPIALLLGMIFGLAFVHPFAKQSRNAARYLLQLSVIGLGFGMNLHQVIAAGKSGFVYTLVGIAFALIAGWLLGRALSVAWKSSYLISVGTAICGGSAIAAVAPVIEAGGEEMSVSIGTVFLLNAVGLLLFPPLGRMLRLTEPQFGLWAALAIHDTSSVVGAGAKYGAVALAVATTVKLARALWIVPLTLATAYWRRREMRAGHVSLRVQWPWFILFFLLAAVMNTYVPSGAAVYPLLSNLARVGLAVTLFLIGTGISRASLKEVGVRPLAQGIALWILVATLSLLLIRAGWIAI